MQKANSLTASENNTIEMAEEVKQEEQFERIIKIGPAFDERNKGKGIAACRMFMVLRGSKGCVVLLINTGWFLPCTREWKEMWIQKSGLDTWEPNGMAVSYCSPVPLHDWQEGRANCDWLGCTCYGDTGYSLADEPFELLLTKGSDAVFEWLTAYYHSTFDNVQPINPE